MCCIAFLIFMVFNFPFPCLPVLSAQNNLPRRRNCKKTRPKLLLRFLLLLLPLLLCLLPLLHLLPQRRKHNRNPSSPQCSMVHCSRPLLSSAFDSTVCVRLFTLPNLDMMPSSRALTGVTALCISLPLRAGPSSFCRLSVCILVMNVVFHCQLHKRFNHEVFFLFYSLPNSFVLFSILGMHHLLHSALCIFFILGIHQLLFPVPLDQTRSPNTRRRTLGYNI